MKVRSDFVTNSSSSSFIISKKDLDKDQIAAIRNHHALMVRMGMINPDDELMFPWIIEENEYYIAGHVDMDNVPIADLLDRIHVPGGAVSWGDYPFYISVPGILQDDSEEDDWRKYLHEDQE